ncbi:polyubiquitin-like [Setaria viridis]|uniref:polyubiquitin-like n=1 Tax=Setaria viridis TaxID=4556 RepID=UPI0014936B59|nr:polyubiquitin-like [Setaria viridis]
MPLVQHPAAFTGAGNDEGLRRRRVVGGSNGIFVRRSAGEAITLEWDGLETVADVKAMIYEKECIHPTLQRLMFGRRLLYNERTLAHYNIQKGSTIHLLKSDLGDGKGKNSIIVKKLTGDIIMLKVELRETTVAYVRGIIAEKAGIRQAQQHLVFHGRPLDDSNTLAHYGIEEDSVLHLAPGRRGGGGPPKVASIYDRASLLLT